MRKRANIWHLIGRLNQTAVDGVFPLSAFKPSSSDSVDRGRSIIRVTSSSTMLDSNFTSLPGLLVRLMLSVWSYLNSCASQYLSKLISKIFTVLAVITSFGRLFQMSTILFVKENFRMLSLLYFFFSYLSFPLVLVFWSRSSKPSVTSLS